MHLICESAVIMPITPAVLQTSWCECMHVRVGGVTRTTTVFGKAARPALEDFSSCKYAKLSAMAMIIDEVLFFELQLDHFVEKAKYLEILNYSDGKHSAEEPHD